MLTAQQWLSANGTSGQTGKDLWRNHPAAFRKVVSDDETSQVKTVGLGMRPIPRSMKADGIRHLDVTKSSLRAFGHVFVKESDP